MTFTREQRQSAYKKLSSEVQSFIMDPETTELISNYLSESGLTTEQSDIADSEILYAMFSLQTLSQALTNIAKLSNKNLNDLSRLKTNLENNIFSKIQGNRNTYTSGSNNKVIEIAKKYSLNQSQTDKLINIVTSVISESKTPDILLETIITNLGISGLLAEQINEELEVRVVGQGANPTKNKVNDSEKIIETKNIPTPTPPKAPEPIKNTINIRIPEIKPLNFPSIEPGETAHITHPTPSLNTAEGREKISIPRYIPTYKPTSTVLNDPSLHDVLPKVTPEENQTISETRPVINKTAEVLGIKYKPRNTSPTQTATPEPVQRPISIPQPVPRFTAIPLTEDNPIDVIKTENQPALTPQNIIENKLNNITTTVKEASKTTITPNTPPTRYAADPYREPLE